MSLLLAVLMRGFVLSLAGLLVVAALRRASAATRHAVGVVCLGAMLALPLGLVCAPKRVVPVSAPLRATAVRAFAPSPRVASLPSEAQPFEAAAEVHFPAPETILLVGWATGSLGLSLRLVFGWATVLRWARRSRPWGFSPEVRVSGEISAPVVVWAGRSLILLPESHVDWSDERRTAALTHEAAHVARGDWATLLLARLALVLHWPNPFAWGLARSVRRWAEDAADDAVLRAGLVPADYATHLLDLAQGGFRSALAVPMAQRPDVHRRIRQVLNPRNPRGSASLSTLVLASALLGGVFVPAVCLVAGQVAKKSLEGGTSQSMYLDVRKGRTKPGTASNGFVGHFADGTTAQVVQVSMRTKDGIRAWKPNGEPIPERRRRAVEHLGDHYRSILVRYRARTADPDGGLGSGPRTVGDPSELGFNSSRNQAGPRRGEGESYQFIDVPKEDGDRASFTFALTNEPWQRYALANDPQGRPKRTPSLRASTGKGAKLRNVVVEHGTAHPVLRGPDGLYLKDAKGVIQRGSAPSTSLSFSPPTDGKSYVAEVTARLRNGRTVKSFWNDNGVKGGAYSFIYHFRDKPDGIAGFRIAMRGYASVEFLGVRLKPNKE